MNSLNSRAMNVQTSGVTVADVFHLALPPETTLLGGAGGLSSRVVWARVSRATMPTYDYLNPGDVALLSNASLQSAISMEGTDALVRIVERLAQEQVAALVISGNVTEIPANVRAIANARSLPIFQLPKQTRMHEVERSVIGLIMDRDAELQRRQTNAQRAFTQLGLDGAGIPAM